MTILTLSRPTHVRLNHLSLATLALVVVAPYRLATAQRPADSLEIGFRDPPASARPRTWWHWTASNVTRGRHHEGSRVDEASVSPASSSPTPWLARGRRVVLSLGDVRDLAEVVVNDTTMPLMWKAPFEVDVTRALHAGTNRTARPRPAHRGRTQVIVHPSQED